METFDLIFFCHLAFESLLPLFCSVLSIREAFTDILSSLHGLGMRITHESTASKGVTADLLLKGWDSKIMSKVRAVSSQPYYYTPLLAPTPTAEKLLCFLM